MAREWTAAQKAAIETGGRTLLVSAAAGAGKTATLTERIIRRLTDPEHPADLSRMLIVTFTRAAAAELKTRISDALTEAIALHPESSHLQKQLLRLGGAHISTIDSFCYEPVKAHFSETGLPATFRLADEAELRPLSDKLMDQLIDEFFKKYAPKDSDPTRVFSLLEDNPFADLIDALSRSRSDETVTDEMRKLYDKLLAFPDGIERLKKEADALDSAADHDFFACAHGAVLAAWKNDFCTSALSFYREASDMLATDPKASKAYLPAFASDADYIRRIAAADTYASARALFQEYAPMNLGSLRNADEVFVRLKKKRDTVKDLIRKTFAQDLFLRRPDDVAQDIRKTAQMCRVLYDFLSAFDARYTEEKRQRGICDFTDNRRNLLRMLTDAEGNPSALAKEYRDSFDEVYIDEYQDVDEVQDTIFRLIGGDHRFMVGDIKQSIYGFRGADPTVFSGYRRTLPPLPTDRETSAEEFPCGNSIFMSENFRCDESVIRVTNAVCGHIFAACPDTVAYRPEDDLGFAKRPPHESYTAPKAEIDVLFQPKPEKDGEADAPSSGRGGDDEEDMKRAVYEYRHVANRIAALLRDPPLLASGEPVTPGDIAILARKNTPFQPLSEALAAVGVPVSSDDAEAEQAGRDLLHGTDMKYLVNLLHILDDPDDDAPLAEVLRAPFPGLSLDDVIRLRDEGRDTDSGSLYESLCRYPERENADPRLARAAITFRDWVENYRSLLPSLPADGILRVMRQDPKVAGRRSKAFLYMYDAARTCRVGSFTGVYSFLRYFERKLETAKRVQADKAAGGRNHVTFMTMHGSKGLEFPVVFLIGCGNAFSEKSLQADMLFEKTTGVALRLYDRTDHAKYNTALRTSSVLALRLQQREEEMRLLYVAMTRARERLILTGIGKETPPDGFDAGDRFSTLTCNNYLSWVLSALARHPEAEAYAQIRYISTDSIRPEAPLAPESLSVPDGMTASTAEFYRHLQEDAPVPSVTERLLRSVPTKVPASRMVKGMLDSCVFLSTDQPVGDESKLPESETGTETCDVRTVESIRESIRLMSSSENNEFELMLAENRKPTAAERGTATHLFLQFCDYRYAVSHGLDAEIARLLDAGFINRRTAAIIDRRQLEAFFASSFFARLLTAVHIEREFRFARFLPLRTLTENAALAEALGESTLYVQGSIDLIAEYADGSLEICDYKTDRITPAEREKSALLAARFAEVHGAQLEQYMAAVSEIYGRTPTAVTIYSLPLGEAVHISV